jgi:hypothetical protein
MTIKAIKQFFNPPRFDVMKNLPENLNSNVKEVIGKCSANINAVANRTGREMNVVSRGEAGKALTLVNMGPYTVSLEASRNGSNMYEKIDQLLRKVAVLEYLE